MDVDHWYEMGFDGNVYRLETPFPLQVPLPPPPDFSAFRVHLSFLSLLILGSVSPPGSSRFPSLFFGSAGSEDLELGFVTQYRKKLAEK